MPQAQIIQAPMQRRTRQPRIDMRLANQVNDALLLAERRLDEALIAAGELTVLLPIVRGESNLAFSVPQNAIAAGANTLNTLTKARADLQEMHRQLAYLRDYLRVPPRMDGPLWKEGETDPDGGGGNG